MSAYRKGLLLLGISLTSLGILPTHFSHSATYTVSNELELAGAESLLMEGDEIHFVTGTYTLDSRIEIFLDDVLLLGLGNRPEDVTIRPATEGVTLVVVAAATGVTLQSLTLEGAQSSYGSALFVEQVADLQLTNCIVRDSTTIFYAPTYFHRATARVEDCTFERNTTSMGEGGGATIFQSGPLDQRVDFVRCLFRENRALQGQGGGLAITARSLFPPQKGGGSPIMSTPLNVHATDCLFIENTAGMGGGGLSLGSHFNSEATATLASCTIRNCSAAGGGGIIGDATVGVIHLFLSDCSVNDNIASSTHGGGALVWSDTRGKIIGFPDPSEVVILDSTFSGNLSQGNGGGLSLVDGASALAYRIERTLFSMNEGVSGGGLAAGEDELLFFKGDSKGFGFGPDVEGIILDSEFDRNRASSMGAGVYLAYSDSQVKGCHFQGNHSGSAGGGLASFGDELLIDNCVFGDPEFKGGGNRGFIGGGAYLALGDSPTRAKGEITAIDLRVINNLFYDNVAEEGAGGLLVDNLGAQFSEFFIGGNVLIENRSVNGVANAMYLAYPCEECVVAFNTLIDNATSESTATGFGTPSTVGVFQASGTLFVNNILSNTDLTDATAILEFGGGSPAKGGGAALPTILRLVDNDLHNHSVIYSTFTDRNQTLSELNSHSTNSGNRIDDPMFAPPGPDSMGIQNPHLSSLSPLIDAATDTAIENLDLNLPVDMDRLYRANADPRIFGGVPDIGADERGIDPTATPTSTITDTPTETLTFTPTFTLTPTATDTPTEMLVITSTPTSTPTGALTPSQTPDPTFSGTPTETATQSPTSDGSATPTPTPVDCDVVPGDNPAVNPRCDAFDLLAILQDRNENIPTIDTDFDDDGNEDVRDLFLFARGWYRMP